MQGDLTAFCHRQSAKMIEYAEGCIDPVLKDEFLQMSAYWLKLIRSTEQSTSKAPLAIGTYRATDSSRRAPRRRTITQTVSRSYPGAEQFWQPCDVDGDPASLVPTEQLRRERRPGSPRNRHRPGPESRRRATMKHAVSSSTIQGGGKARREIASLSGPEDERRTCSRPLGAQSSRSCRSDEGVSAHGDDEGTSPPIQSIDPRTGRRRGCGRCAYR